MKKIFTLLSIVALSSATFAQKQVATVVETLSVKPSEMGSLNSKMGNKAETTHELIQYNNDILPQEVNIIRCPDATNAWGRLYDLADYGITNDFTITNIDGAGIIWKDGYAEGKVFIYSGPKSLELSLDDMVDTELYAVYTNKSGAREWTWFEMDVTDQATVPGNSKIYVTMEGYFAPATDATNLGSFSALYNEEGQTGPSYFGSPTSDCGAPNATGAKAWEAVGMIGTTDVSKFSTLLKVSGTSETMGTVEIGSTKLAVYPNPATTEVNIKLDGSKIADVTVADITGRVIPVNFSKDGKVDTSRLAAGVYFLRVKDDKGVTRIQKIIKK